MTQLKSKLVDTSNSEATNITKQVTDTMVLFPSILSFLINKQVVDHTANNGKVIMATNNLPNNMVSNDEDVLIHEASDGLDEDAHKDVPILEASAGLLDEGFIELLDKDKATTENDAMDINDKVTNIANTVTIHTRNSEATNIINKWLLLWSFS